MAAIRAGRSYVGYDLDESYIRLAESRVAEERRRLAGDGRPPPRQMSLLGAARPAAQPGNPPAGVREGRAAKVIARDLIEAAGFTDIQANARQSGGVVVNFTARDRTRRMWLFEVAGSYTTYRSGMKKTDVFWRTVGKAAVLREVGAAPLLVLTAELPARGSAVAKALREMTGPTKAIRAVIGMLESAALEELQAFAAGDFHS